jgi:hypothetical protein
MNLLSSEPDEGSAEGKADLARMETSPKLGTGNKQWLSILFTAHDDCAIGNLAA